MSRLFHILARLPLWLLHALGGMTGWMAYWGSSGYRQHFSENAALAGVSPADRRKAVAEAGKLVLELPRLWVGKPVAIEWDGAENIDTAFASGQGVVFLTPHLGSFEIAAQAYAARYGVGYGAEGGKPMTVLFRPPRKAWLTEFVMHARARPGLKTAPTTLAGVKQLIKALKAQECVGLLPDQVPPKSQGLWAEFFGREAFTMTLSARLAHQTGAVVLLAWGERLAGARGYTIHVRPMAQALDADLSRAVRQINQAMEQLIMECPSQYLWGYARYKAPKDEISGVGP
jgi:KDO2-lipid IV(A) lauroyltransferase